MSVADLRKIMEVKRYSENTILAYCSFISKIERELNIPVNRLSETDLHGYVYSQIHSKKISRSTQKQLVNALKLYFLEVEGVETNFRFLLPRKSDFVLPEVLSKKEVHAILQTAKNTKHKAILALLYRSAFEYACLSMFTSNFMTCSVTASIIGNDMCKKLLTKMKHFFVMNFAIQLKYSSDQTKKLHEHCCQEKSHLCQHIPHIFLRLLYHRMPHETLLKQKEQNYV